MQVPAERLDQIAHRFAELEARMASGTLEGDEFVQASRDYAELEPIAKLAWPSTLGGRGGRDK